MEQRGEQSHRESGLRLIPICVRDSEVAYRGSEMLLHSGVSGARVIERA